MRISDWSSDVRSSDLTVIDPPTLTNLTIRTDAAPTYFTSFDDKTLIFDSYDSAVDSTLQKSKVQVYAYTIPAWVHADDAIPDLPEMAFSVLVEEAKIRAALRISQDRKSTRLNSSH